MNGVVTGRRGGVRGSNAGESAVGMSAATYTRARTVVAAAEENPEEFGDLSA